MLTFRDARSSKSRKRSERRADREKGECVYFNRIYLGPFHLGLFVRGPYIRWDKEAFFPLRTNGLLPEFVFADRSAKRLKV
jgi:hypothetical protein